MNNISDIIGALNYALTLNRGPGDETIKLPRQLVQDVIWRLQSQIEKIEWHRKHGDLDPSDFDL